MGKKQGGGLCACEFSTHVLVIKCTCTYSFRHCDLVQLHGFRTRAVPAESALQKKERKKYTIVTTDKLILICRIIYCN